MNILIIIRCTPKRNFIFSQLKVRKSFIFFERKGNTHNGRYRFYPLDTMNDQHTNDH